MGIENIKSGGLFRRKVNVSKITIPTGNQVSGKSSIFMKRQSFDSISRNEEDNTELPEVGTEDQVLTVNSDGDIVYKAVPVDITTTSVLATETYVAPVTYNDFIVIPSHMNGMSLTHVTVGTYSGTGAFNITMTSGATTIIDEALNEGVQTIEVATPYETYRDEKIDIAIDIASGDIAGIKVVAHFKQV